MSVEQIVIEEIRELTPEKQQEVLNFIRLLQQDATDYLTPNRPNQIAKASLEDNIEIPTASELDIASEIIARGLTRAMNLPVRPSEVIWAEFEAVRSRIAAKAKNSESAVDGDL